MKKHEVVQWNIILTDFPVYKNEKHLVIRSQKRQVYNGPRPSNLSQQQQQKFRSKMIFEQ